MPSNTRVRRTLRSMAEVVGDMDESSSRTRGTEGTILAARAQFHRAFHGGGPKLPLARNFLVLLLLRRGRLVGALGTVRGFRLSRLGKFDDEALILGRDGGAAQRLDEARPRPFAHLEIALVGGEADRTD